MSFEISCPSCGQKMVLEDEHIGCEIVCPVCKQEFCVEDVEAPAALIPLPVQLKVTEPEVVAEPADDAPKSKKVKKKKIKSSSGNKLADAANKTIRRIKILIGIILLGVLACWGYNIYKDIYWSTQILERVYATLTAVDKRVVYHSIDELKIENKSLRNLPDNEKVVKMLNQYIYLFVLSQDNLKVVKNLIEDIPEDDYKVFIGDIVKKCHKCSSGLAVCKYCKGTRRCHVCGGSGQITVSRVDETYTYEACRKDCAYCSTPVICRSCNGNVFLYDRNEVKKIVPAYKEELIKIVKARIADYKSFSYVSKKFLDRFFGLFEKKKQTSSSSSSSMNNVIVRVKPYAGGGK